MNAIGVVQTLAPFLVGGILGAAWVQSNDSADDSQPKAKGPDVGITITVTSVMVDDQEKALAFYTEKLGFVKKTDVPAGGGRWLTVVSPEQPNGPELLLEPIGFPFAKTFQKELFDAGIPWTSFGVRDAKKAYETLKGLGVAFRSEPMEMGPVTIAVLEDTCGNLIQLAQA
jgi:catechol 2,3-dioxygenase-like lactoylglutathione lyase family enzyme